jgi:signal peptidase I
MKEHMKREPLTAFVLSFLTPGLGQLYNGQLIKAILLYCLGLLILVLFSLSGLFFFFYGMVSWLAMMLGYMLFVIIDAAMSAKRLNIIRVKKYNKWYLYLLIILINAFLINSLLASFTIPTIKAYKLPAASMAPTLMIGDHLIVNKNYYTNGKPQRGDVVIFPDPSDPRKDFIRRIIGLPGEKIEIVGKKVYINGQPLEESYVIYVMGTPEGGLSPTTAVTKHFGPVNVPKGKFFVLGDNRDNSLDSRHFGFVDRAALKGKALYIYLAKDKKRIGKNIK